MSKWSYFWVAFFVGAAAVAGLGVWVERKLKKATEEGRRP
jgi:hypothetical protein